MEIFGQEYGFALTVGGSAEIAELCPGGDMARMTEILSRSYFETVDFTAKFCAIMAKGYDDMQRFSGVQIGHAPLTPEMVKALPTEKFREVQAAAQAAFRGDTAPSVEVEPSKKKESE